MLPPCCSPTLEVVAGEKSMPTDGGKAKLGSRAVLVALLAVLTAAGAAPARSDTLRDVVERTLSASYVFVALRVGSSIAPGTGQWTDSLAASVDGMMKILPADCLAANFQLNFCGLGITDV